MKRNRLSSRKRISADATELGRLATGLADSGGKLEEVFWEKQLVELIEKLLQDGAEDDLNASLDRLFDSNASAHDALADTVEAIARALGNEPGSPLMPGDPELNEEIVRRVEGIPVEPVLAEQMRTWSNRLEVNTLPTVLEIKV